MIVVAIVLISFAILSSSVAFPRAQVLNNQEENIVRAMINPPPLHENIKDSLKDLQDSGRKIGAVNKDLTNYRNNLSEVLEDYKKTEKEVQDKITELDKISNNLNKAAELSNDVGDKLDGDLKVETQMDNPKDACF